MKKNLFYVWAALLVCCMGLSFAACSDDDDDNKDNGENTTEDVVSGTYTGSLVVTLEGEEVANETKDIVLTKKSDTTLDLSINDFVLNVNAGGLETTVDLGDLTVSDCTLTATDNGYTFSGSIELQNISVPLGGQEIAADCDVQINNATVKEGTLSLPIVIGVSIFGGHILDVNAQFDGTK